MGAGEMGDPLIETVQIVVLLAAGAAVFAVLRF